jgi:hypothetical protein
MKFLMYCRNPMCVVHNLPAYWAAADDQVCENLRRRNGGIDMSVRSLFLYLHHDAPLHPGPWRYMMKLP